MADLLFDAVHGSSVRTTEACGYLGDAYGGDLVTLSVSNGYGVATDVWTPATDGTDESTITFTAPNATTSTTYTISASNTLAEIAEALGDLGTDLGRAVTKWYLVDQTTAVCTAKNPGVTGTFTSGTHITWTGSPAGSTGTDIPVGRVVLRSALGSAPGMSRVSKARLPAASITLKPTDKQVITFTYTSVADTDSIITVIEEPTRGIKFAEATQYATSHAATLTAHTAALESALNAKLGAGYGAVAANATNDITITTDVKGAAILATSEVVGDGGGACATAFTTGSPGALATDVIPSILGVLTRKGQTSTNTSGAPVLEPLKLGEVVRRGLVLVANTQSPALGDLPWMDPATGLLYNAGASGYIPLPTSKIRWTGVNYSEGLAEVYVNF